MGIGKACAYIPPEAIVWFGPLKTDVHPTLAGVVLELMTAVNSKPFRELPLDTIGRTFHELMERFSLNEQNPGGG